MDVNCAHAYARIVQASAKPPIKSLMLDDAANALSKWQEPDYRAKQIADWLYQKRVNSFEAMTDLPQTLRERLTQEFSFDRLETVRVLGSKDTTQKILFRLSDGNLIESVLIPASPALYGERSDRRTICVSTQVGCAYGCKFCASGLDGFSRNLLPNEIVDQLIAIEQESGEKIDNVVFMGMGEPLANERHVFAAIARLTDPQAFGLGARHVTVSTVGLVPGIKHLTTAHPQVGLAVSFHAATDELRSQLVPPNDLYPLAVLEEAMAGWRSATHRRPSIEWAMIDRVNDTEEQASLLVPIARRLGAHVNLIPLNPTPGYPVVGSSPARIRRFVDVLEGAKVNVTVRDTRGRSIDAACGQLALSAQAPSS